MCILNDQATLAVIGAVSAIGGALATFFPTFWLSRIKDRELKQSVATQFYAEIKATLKTEQYRGYINSIRQILLAFDNNSIQTYSFIVEISNDRFPIFRANLNNLGLLEPKLQGKIVLFYQLLEAIVQDIKPGGLLNRTAVGRKPYQELLDLLTEAKEIAEEIMAEIENTYPNVS